MGLAAAVTVVVAVADRAHPAAGAARLRRPPGPRARPDPGPAGLGAPKRPSHGAERWGRFVTRRPVAVLIVAVARPAASLAIPALDLRLGLPDDGMAGPDTTQRKAYDLLADGFGPGLQRAADLSWSTPPRAADPQRRPRPGGRRHRARCPTSSTSARRRSTRPATPRCSASSRPAARTRRRPPTWCTPSAPRAGRDRHRVRPRRHRRDRDQHRHLARSSATRWCPTCWSSSAWRSCC